MAKKPVSISAVGQMTQDDVDRLVHNMGALAGAYSNMWGVWLTPGTHWSANPRTGELTYDLALAAILDDDGRTGVMLHEIAHLRYTGNFSLPKSMTDDDDRKYAAYLINLFEDARIERRFVGEFPGAAKYFERLRAGYKGEKVTRQFARGKPHMQFLGAVYALLFSDAEPQITHQKVEDAVRKHRQEIRDLRDATSTGAMRGELLRKGGIFDTLRKLRALTDEDAAQRKSLPQQQQAATPQAQADDEDDGESLGTLTPDGALDEQGALDEDGDPVSLGPDDAMPAGSEWADVDPNDPAVGADAGAGQMPGLDAEGNADLTIPDPDGPPMGDGPTPEQDAALKEALEQIMSNGGVPSMDPGEGNHAQRRREPGELVNDESSEDDLDREDWDVDLEDEDEIDEGLFDPTLDAQDAAAMPQDLRDLLDEALSENAQDEALTPAERREAQGLADSLYGTRRLRGAVGDKIERLARQRESCADDELYGLTDNWKAVEAVQNAVYEEASVLGRNLKSVLRENRFDRWSAIGYRSGGRLHARNIAQVPAGNEAIFRRKNRPKNRQYAASLLVDVSGSMGGKINDAITALVLAGDAMDQCPGIDFAVYCFGHDNAALKPFDRDWKVRAGKVGAGAALIQKMGGSTALTECVQRAGADTLRRYPGEDWRKLMVVITDGMPNDATTAQAALRELEAKHDFMCVGIGIRTPGVLARMFSSWAAIDDPYKLPEALMRALRQHIRKG
jgi:uncharacterized protein YegL